MIREGFFAYLGDRRSTSIGFGSFGFIHFLVVFLLAYIIFLMAVIYKNMSDSQRTKMIKNTMNFIVFLEILRHLTFIFIHNWYFNVAYLPLHLCSLMIFVALIHTIKPNKTTGEILYSLGMPGFVAAILFPDWTFYPIINFYPLQAFLIHGVQLAYVVMLLVTREIKPNIKNLWKTVVFILLVAPPIYIFNLRFGTNFLFINQGSENSPLEIFVDIFGNPGFLIPFVGLLLLVWFFLYLPYNVKFKCFVVKYLKR
ncbi:MAG: TIGR02206 family membrane protein [Defluviitaleaceae bacterium]|nr:TIGR02206 family membrane protein [Defluviitaleaceae bacterium]